MSPVLMVVVLFVGLLLLLPVSLLLLDFLRRQRIPAVEVGGIYSIIAAKTGGYKLAKVLAAQPGVVHLRLYEGQWPERPIEANPTTLRVGSIDSPNAGIGHLPMAAHVFAAWAPELLQVAGVTAEELDGYEEWKKAKGGIWGA